MFLKSVFRILPKDPLHDGLEAFNRGRLKEAIGQFEPLLDDDNEEIRKKAGLYACEAHLQWGDEIVDREPEKAAVHFEAARQLQPRFADIHNRLGETYRRLDRQSESRECFEAAKSINPRYFRAILNLCHSYTTTQEYHRAQSELHGLAEWCPSMYRDTLHVLADACARGNEVDWDARFAQVREMAPSRVDMGRRSALVAIQRGDAKVAEETLRELLRDHPRFPDLWHLLGVAQGAMDMTDASIESFQRALEINPHYLKARINLGITYLELEQLDSAQRELKLALQTDPNNTLARTALDEITVLRVD